MSLAPAASRNLKCVSRRHVLRALEHHVLEQVREAGAARLLVGRADVIPEVHGHQRQPMVLAEDHVETVRQRVFLERQPWDAGRRGIAALLRPWRGSDGQGQHDNSEQGMRSAQRLHHRSSLGCNCLPDRHEQCKQGRFPYSSGSLFVALKRNHESTKPRRHQNSLFLCFRVFAVAFEVTNLGRLTRWTGRPAANCWVRARPGPSRLEPSRCSGIRRLQRAQAVRRLEGSEGCLSSHRAGYRVLPARLPGAAAARWPPVPDGVGRS